MKAAVVETLGQPPRYCDFEEPVPAPGEVMIEVKAAGLHAIVKSLAKGAHYLFDGKLPFVPGVDGVGTRPDGGRVYFGRPRGPWGTMAQRCAAPASYCIPLPDGISDTEAAAVANPGMSAWLSIKERAGLATGETILIQGATGVAGQLAIQAARLLGAGRIIGTGRNVDALAGQPLDAVITLTQPEDALREAFAAEAAHGIDVIIDYLWGRPTELLLETLARRSRRESPRTTRLVEVGESAGTAISLPGAVLRSVDLRLMGSGFGSVAIEGILAAIPNLFALVAEGKLKMDVDAVPLAEVESAWDKIEKGRRVVFTV